MKFKETWPILAFIVLIASFAFLMYQCSDDKPVRGVVQEKIETKADTSVAFDPVVQIYKERIVPAAKILVVKDDDFGRVRYCHVDSATFYRYNVGDRVEEKGRYYYGKTKKRK